MEKDQILEIRLAGSVDEHIRKTLERKQEQLLRDSENMEAILEWRQSDGS